MWESDGIKGRYELFGVDYSVVCQVNLAVLCSVEVLKKRSMYRTRSFGGSMRGAVAGPEADGNDIIRLRGVHAIADRS